VIGAWKTNNRVMRAFIQDLPAAVWDAPVPGAPRKTIRTIGAHIHNTRCAWIRTLGSEHGVTVPARVDARAVTRRQLAAALKRSGRGIEALLELGLESGGSLPPSRGYVWRNLSLDVHHVLTYFVAHEGHHRGQIVMIARQTGHRLPATVIAGLWQWQDRKE
jgi:uncharacterized damage-inducible protein DinB